MKLEKGQSKKVSCVTIGEGNLLLCCLEYLTTSDVDVISVFTNTEAVRKYCDENKIKHWERSAKIEEILKEEKFDYLFSISNPRIIKENVLKLPRLLSINYHDSPLPAYAGVHATSWALMNGEIKHGISWHVIEIGIDTGDILQSAEVKVAETDSALTLNLKCQEAAKQTFKTLVSEIKTGNVVRKVQPKTGRSYYGLYAIPPNAGILTFNLRSKEIYNLARALEFGNHENSLGSPKLSTSSKEIFLVTNVEPARNDIYKSKLPGTILDIVDDTLVVSTLDTPLLVSFANLDGTHPVPSSYKDHDLYTGAKLSNIYVNIDSLTEIRKKETFWRNRMVAYQPTTFFRQRLNVVAGIIDVSTESNLKTVVLPLPKFKVPREFEEVNDYLFATFLAFMARICCVKTVCVGILADKNKIPTSALSLYSDICPGLFNIDMRHEISSILNLCHDSLQKHHTSHSFLVDMFYRYPELRGRKQVPHHNIVIGSLSQSYPEREVGEKILHECNLLLLFENFGTEMHLLYNERPSQDFSHIQDVIKHFPMFLQSIENLKSSAKLSEVTMVSEDELKRLYPTIEHIELKKSPFVFFENQCRKTPKNIAISSTKMTMTYLQCYNEAKRLARIIKTKTSNKTCSRFGNQIVALHLPNSVSYVISVLATIHSDKSFLPLPLDYPPERLSFTMKDADVKTVIITANAFNKSDFSAIKNTKISLGKIGDEELVMLQFESEESTIENKSHEEKNHDTLDDDVCYVMYTSGSTGRPKGVQVTKTNVVNLANAQIKLWSLTENDTIAQFASIGFDATVSEVFTALFSGATLAVLGENERLGQEFIVSMNNLRVNTITLPPSALNVYKPSDLPFLQNVISAGEPCTLNTAYKWLSTGRLIKFFNAYGPTETTVCATNYEFTPGLGHEDVNREIPIGKAIPGASVYLFDEFLQPVPPDVVGEIYVGGLGLSKGYIGHARHYNAEKFIQNPLVPKEMLLYKTGDHAFQDEDGTLTYIGRLDDMVKIRGQRVDLSEIEQVLIQHPKIDVAVVVVHRCQKLKELSIAAYVSPSFVYTSELREYLTKVLPKYMIPTYIKKLEVKDFPMTINGKIDRKLIEKDESVHEQQHNVGTSHLNETQLSISKMWCSLLKIEESFAYSFHRQSSFTELGGNSLQLVLLQRMLEETLHVQLSFTDLGTADTIEEFAEVIKRKKDVLRKTSQGPSKDENNLRNLILNDAQLDIDFLSHPARRGSVQFQYFTSCTATDNPKYPKNILISGVTGFLGAFLLSELLENTNAHICCMVRESTEARGVGRIMENMRRYNLWKFSYSSRIAVVISDLSQERLGIAPDIYNSLCNVIDVVFMNAAMMNFNTNYEDHKIANVDSTKEFIKFATTGVQKYVFQSSSLSVFLFPSEPKNGEEKHRMCYESEVFEDPCAIEGGYGQSKWASEKVMMEALEHLPGGAIFRPARISGCTTNGVGPKNDLFASMLIGMGKIGYFPDMDFPFDLTPVDYCAKSMVEIAVKICNETHDHPKVYHLFNPKTFPFRDMFKGMNLMPLPLNEWRAKLKSANEEHKELIPLTPFFMSQFWDRAEFWPIFDTSNTDKMISQKTKDLMLESSKLLEIYKTFFGII